VPHFLGLHAVQIVPVLTLILGDRIASTAWRRRAALVVAASYGVLFVILLAQALGGEPVSAPGPSTLAALALWATATTGGIVYAMARGRNGSGRRAISAGV
jgi:hypothetical protein